jgi:uncharacterized protein (TIGR03435 family)
MRLSFFVAVATLLALAPLTFAQEAAGKLVFEVASVKPGSAYGPGVGRAAGARPSGFQAMNTSLTSLIMIAFRLSEGQVVGGPRWIAEDGWNIDAKYPAGASQTQMPEMLQALLVERFHLTFHRETRTLAIYALIVAKGGSKLRASEVGQTTGTGGSSTIRYKGETVTQLTAQLSALLQRQVVDKTGLTGRYDMELTFAPVNPRSIEAAADETRPSIFTAIQEQLGLKLEPTKEPVEVLVVDGAERPTQN